MAVREAVIVELPGTLDLFAGLEAGGDVRSGTELANALVALDAGLGLNWRSQLSMLLSFPALFKVSLTASPLTFSEMGCNGLTVFSDSQKCISV